MNTYVLMMIGIVMIIMGSLFCVVMSINRGEKEVALFFFVGAVISTVTFLFLPKTDSNIFTYNIPIIIAIKIIVFVVGLMMILSILFSPIIDKIKKKFFH